MTTDESAFLTAVRDHPDDDTARLVYADWLQENGDPDRGEFIRAQVELFRTPPDSETAERRRSALYRREAELLKRHKAAWLAPFTPYAKESSFVRGFVQELEVSAGVFLRHAERWFALTPLTRVKITHCTDWDHTTHERTRRAAALLGSPHLARLAALDLERLALTADDLEALAAQPDLSRLRELVLAWNALENRGAIRLADMPQLGGLEALDLRGNGIMNAGGRAVALSRHLDRVKELRISRNTMRDKTWALLENRFGDALVG
jgi:uncharacterized protein (TIGR02996 family)